MIPFTIALTVAPAPAVDITACNQTVPAGEVGVLRANLVCDGAYAVFLDSRATLLLSGHSLAGPDEAVDADGVGCLDDCTVSGPGEISGFEEGIVTNAKLVRVSDVFVHGCGVGIKAPRLHLTNVTASDNAEVGLTAERLKGTGITANDNGGYGFYGFRFVGENVTMDRNALGAIEAHDSFRGVAVALHDNDGAAVISARVSARGLVASGNTGGGVYGTRVTVRDGSLTGNGVTGDGAFDLGSTRPPRILQTLCGTSLRWNVAPYPQSWGVCTFD